MAKDKTRSFAFSIAVVFTSLLVLFSIFVMGYNFYKSSSISFMMSEKIAQRTLKSIIEKTVSHIHKTDSILKTIMENNSNAENVFINKYFNEKIMYGTVKHEDSFASIYIADSEGNFLQARRLPTMVIRQIQKKRRGRNEYWKWIDKNGKTIKEKSFATKYDPRNRPWFKDSLSNKAIHISKPYQFKTINGLGITVSIPLYKKNKIQFIAATDITLGEINTFLCKEAKEINSDIFLIDSKNDIIASSNKNLCNSVLDAFKSKRKELYYNNQGYLIIGKQFKIDSLKNGVLLWPPRMK